MVSEKDVEKDERVPPPPTEPPRVPTENRLPSVTAMAAIIQQELDSYKPSTEYRLERAEQHRTVLGWSTALLIVLLLVVWGLHTSQRAEMLDELNYLEGQVECFDEAARIADLDLARSC